MPTEFPRRRGDYEYTAFAYPTGRGTYIAKMAIWLVSGSRRESAPDFKDLPTFGSEEDALRVAVNSAEHWIDMHMLKPVK